MCFLTLVDIIAALNMGSTTGSFRAARQILLLAISPLRTPFQQPKAR